MRRKDKLNYPHQTDSDFFGFTSDWHIGNKHTNEDYIQDYLDLLKERGVKQIFHGGDLFEGYKIYPHQINDLLPDCFGIKEQIKHYNKLIPKQKDLNMKLISGNHLIKNHKGKNVVEELCYERRDIDYLGKYEGSVGLKDGVVMEIIHPSRGSPYKRLFEFGEYLNLFPINPDILGVGHKHISNCHLYNDVACYHLGTFLEEPNRKNNKFSPDIGAWIVELDIDGGEIISNKSDWISYE